MTRQLCVLLFVVACCHGDTDLRTPSLVVPAPSDAKDSLRRQHFAAEVAHNVALRLQGQLNYQDNKNYLMSPPSVAVIIGQLMLGARGASQHSLREMLVGPRSASGLGNTLADIADPELHRLLGGSFQNLQQNASTNDAYQLRAGNTFFMQVGLQVMSRFLNDVKKYYHSSYSPADFRNDPTDTMNAINKWGSDNTGGLIPNILTAPLPPRTAVVLMNAIYFRARWETPFSAALTIPGHFRLNDSHLVDVQNMRGQFEVKFADSAKLGCRLIVLPYKSKDVNMYIILPKQGADVKKVAKQLTWKQIEDFVATAEENSVVIVLPKMTLTTSISLKEPLFRHRPEKGDGYTKNRTTSTTTPKSAQPVKKAEFDLTGASKDERFNVDDVLHQVSLQVSETGTEAAAVSISSGWYSGDVKNFKVDRPFIFFIRHEPSLVNLFWGVIMDPTNGEYH